MNISEIKQNRSWWCSWCYCPQHLTAGQGMGWPGGAGFSLFPREAASLPEQNTGGKGLSSFKRRKHPLHPSQSILSLIFQETRGFIWFNWRWLPFLIFVPFLKLPPCRAQREQTGTCEEATTREVPVPRGRATPLLGLGKENSPPLSCIQWGFAEPGKEVNSKGRKWPRDHNNMWKAKPVLPWLYFKLF